MFDSNKVLDCWSCFLDRSGPNKDVHLTSRSAMLCRYFCVFGYLALVGVVGTRCSAQLPTANLATADKPIYNSEQEPGGPPPAAESIQNVQLPPGFSVGLFAYEPMVQNPIAMTFDDQGEVWVAENYTYAERPKRFDLELRDRIIVLKDTNFDGVADNQLVFHDDLQMLTGIALGQGGVWAMCPLRSISSPTKIRTCDLTGHRKRCSMGLPSRERTTTIWLMALAGDPMVGCMGVAELLPPVTWDYLEPVRSIASQCVEEYGDFIRNGRPLKY